MNLDTYIINDTHFKDIAHALNSELRLKIIKILSTEPKNISQLCEILQIPQSTCTLNIKILEKANLIETKFVPAKSKGVQKICSLKYGRILLSFDGVNFHPKESNIYTTEMPIGLFTDFEISAPCGMVNDKKVIGQFDNPSAFLSPSRASAGLIWFSHGFIEYRFSKDMYDLSRKIKSLTFSMEICSEFPSHNNSWLSDITVWFNDIELGYWTSPGDFGGSRGKLTPLWWDINSSQFGLLTRWKIDKNGTYVNQNKISDLTLEDIDIDNVDLLNLKIGVKKDANHRGGINIFGKNFGNYEQGVKLEIEVE